MAGRTIISRKDMILYLNYGYFKGKLLMVLAETRLSENMVLL